ncbi:PAS domain S-box protein [Patescibacteria group bacterium]|nr:PAS domain S-box protein [Patescibacteria group bacterium]
MSSRQEQSTIFKQLDRWGTAIVHWQAEAVASLFFGIPLVLIIGVYLNFGLSTLVKLLALVLFLAIGVWVPLWLLLAKFSIRPVRGVIKRYLKGEEIGEKEIIKTIEFFLAYPRRHATKAFFLTLFAYVSGALPLWLGIVPEMIPNLKKFTLISTSIGFVVGLIEAFLNYALLETYLRGAIESLLSTYAGKVGRVYKYLRVTLFTKIFLLVYFVSLAVQVALLTIFLGRILIFYPGEFIFHFTVLVTFVLFGTFFSLIMATIFARNLTSPLHRVVTWSREIIRGNLDAKIYLATDDESADVLEYSEKMVENLKRGQELMAAEKNKLAVVLSGVADGVVAVDQSYGIVVFNSAAAGITGWLPEEAIGKNLDTILLIYGLDHSRVSIDRLCPREIDNVTDKITYFEPNLSLKTKTGSEKQVNLMAATIKEGSVADVSYILTFHDVTEERELERMKLDFVAMAAHELRTPITSIIGYLSVLQDELGSSLNMEHQQFFRRALTSGKRLIGLMENLLSITRIEKGRLTLRLASIDWQGLVKEAVTEFTPLADEKGLQLRWKPLKTSLPMVLVDSLRISEVLNNLLNNAITYTAKGAISIWCEYDDKEKMVITHIKDTGPGIPEESMPHLFEKFYRIAGPLEEGSKGTGLGLYISKSITTMHGGRIWVKSDFGKGSTFSFSLPIAE